MYIVAIIGVNNKPQLGKCSITDELDDAVYTGVEIAKGIIVPVDEKIWNEEWEPEIFEIFYNNLKYVAIDKGGNEYLISIGQVD